MSISRVWAHNDCWNPLPVLAMCGVYSSFCFLVSDPVTKANPKYLVYSWRRRGNRTRRKWYSLFGFFGTASQVVCLPSLVVQRKLPCHRSDGICSCNDILIRYDIYLVRAPPPNHRALCCILGVWYTSIFTIYTYGRIQSTPVQLAKSHWNIIF